MIDTLKLYTERYWIRDYSGWNFTGKCRIYLFQNIKFVAMTWGLTIELSVARFFNGKANLYVVNEEDLELFIEKMDEIIRKVGIEAPSIRGFKVTRLDYFKDMILRLGTVSNNIGNIKKHIRLRRKMITSDINTQTLSIQYNQEVVFKLYDKIAQIISAKGSKECKIEGVPLFLPLLRAEVILTSHKVIKKHLQINSRVTLSMIWNENIAKTIIGNFFDDVFPVYFKIDESKTKNEVANELEFANQVGFKNYCMFNTIYSMKKKNNQSDKNIKEFIRCCGNSPTTVRRIMNEYHKYVNHFDTCSSIDMLNDIRNQIENWLEIQWDKSLEPFTVSNQNILD